MVGWYDPGQLAQTIVEVAISTIFGAESDFRMLEALTQPQDAYFDCPAKPGQAAWIDYVGDTGDGWNSTYSMAYWMTRPGPRAAHLRRRPGLSDRQPVLLRAASRGAVQGRPGIVGGAVPGGLRDSGQSRLVRQSRQLHPP